MRGELDEALARIARREELLRRRADAADRDPVTEVAEAVRRVVAGYPGLSVTLHVDNGTSVRPVRVAWSAETVTVTVDGPTEPIPAPTDHRPPGWPLPAQPATAWTVDADGLSDDPDARLAELIRRHPALLDNLRRTE